MEDWMSPRTGNRIQSLWPPGQWFKYSLGLRRWEVITTDQLLGGLYEMNWWAEHSGARLVQITVATDPSRDP